MSIMRTAWVRDTEFRGDARGQLGHLSALVNPLKKRKPKLRVRLLPNEFPHIREAFVRYSPPTAWAPGASFRPLRPRGSIRLDQAEL